MSDVNLEKAMDRMFLLGASVTACSASDDRTDASGPTTALGTGDGPLDPSSVTWTSIEIGPDGPLWVIDHSAPGVFRLDP